MPLPLPFFSLAIGLTPLPALPPGGELRLEGGQAGAEFGRALATGDVNGDGFGDLLVGAPRFDARVGDEGRVTLYLGSAGGLSPVPNWTGTGTQPFEHFGASVSIADVNGDGKDDVLVSSPDLDRRPSSRALLASLGHGQGNGLSSEGRVSVFLGTLGGLAAAPQRMLTGIEFGEHFGAALAGAGDVNGDGYEDVIVGATGKAQGLGGVFLFAGSPSGLRALPSWIRIGGSRGEGWGSLVGSAGDLDGDGFDDVIASAPTRGSNGVTELFLGSGTGPAASPDRSITKGVTVLGPSVNLDLSGPTESLYVARSSTAAVEWRRFLASGSATFGTFPGLLDDVRALTCGDLNGDGLEDVIASTPDFDYGTLHGRVWTYTNQPGQAFSPAASFPVFDGDQVGAEWGAALAAIDVDGDGADELFIGAPRHAAGATDEGLVVLVPGHKGFALTPTGTTFALETYSAASDDFDGDGFSDLLFTSGFGISQLLEVRYGSPSGLPATRDQLLDQPSFPSFDQLTITLVTGDFNGDGFGDALVSFFPATWGGHGGYAVTSEQHSLYLGSSSGLSPAPAANLMNWGLATDAGDVNGDGRDDLVMVRSSSVDVHFGRATGLSTTPDQVFPGFPYAYDHSILAGNLNGDGFADVLLVYNFGAQVIPMFGSPAGLVEQPGQTNLPASVGYSFLVDANGDGLDDLLLRMLGDSNKYRTYLRAPTGFTRAEQWWEDPLAPGADSSFLNNPVKTVFDADRDGHLDLLIHGNRLHRGTSAGVERSPSWCGPSSTFPTYNGYYFEPPVAGDFDGDGRLDLLVQTTLYGSTWQVMELDEP